MKFVVKIYGKTCDFCTRRKINLRRCTVPWVTTIVWTCALFGSISEGRCMPVACVYRRPNRRWDLSALADWGSLTERPACRSAVNRNRPTYPITQKRPQALGMRESNPICLTFEKLKSFQFVVLERRQPVCVLRIENPINFSKRKVAEFKNRKFWNKTKKIQKLYGRIFAEFSAVLCKISIFKPHRVRVPHA